MESGPLHLTETEAQSTSFQGSSRRHILLGQRGERRSIIQDQGVTISQWEESDFLSCTSNNINRCFQVRVGGSDGSDPHRGTLDCLGTRIPYQLSRIDGGISISQVLGFQLLQPTHSAVTGQQGCDLLHQQTHSKSVSDLAFLLWEWCLRRGLTIHAEHIPGILNYMADAESRKPVEGSDWKLDPHIFRQLSKHWVRSMWICLRLTTIPSYQLSSFLPDPEATRFDAFFQEWVGSNCYAFPRSFCWVESYR